jgi:hypothetical protein
VTVKKHHVVLDIPDLVADASDEGIIVFFEGIDFEPS